MPRERVTDQQVAMMTRWMELGETWIGIWENKALDSTMLGHRVAVPYDDSLWDRANIGDGGATEDMFRRLGFIPWQYRLQFKVRTVAEAVKILEGEGEADAFKQR